MLQNRLHALGWKVAFADGVSNNIYEVRNLLLRWDKEKKGKQIPFDGLPYDYILWVDSDQVFSPEQFDKLFESKKDIVSGWYAINHTDTCFGWQPNRRCKIEEAKNPNVKMFSLPTERDHNFKDGFLDVDWTGFGFLLMKKGVLESIETPWFEPLPFGNRYMMDDEAFCCKARQAGYKVYVNTKVRIGHSKTFVI